MDKNTVRRVSVRYSSFGAESESGSKPVKCLVKGKTRAGDGYDGENRPAAPAPLAPGGQEIEPCPTNANISEGKLRSIVIGSDVADCASLALGRHLPGLLHLPGPRKRLRQVPGPRRPVSCLSIQRDLRNCAAPAALRQVRQPGGQSTTRQPSNGLAAARHPAVWAWGCFLSTRRCSAKAGNAGPGHAMPAGGGSDD